MLNPISAAAPGLCADTGCEFLPTCTQTAQSIMSCKPERSLCSPEQYRASAWYVSLTAPNPSDPNGLFPEDDALLDILRPYMRYWLRCAPCDSVMLAYLHFRDMRDQQKNELAQSLEAVSVPGIRPTRQGGWKTSRYGEAYEDLVDNHHDVWGGGNWSADYR